MGDSQPVPVPSFEEMEAVLRDAIRSRRPISAVYDARSRLLYPHMIRRNKKRQIRVLCYQLGGESISGLSPNDGAGEWRCLALEKFGSVSLSDSAWQTAPGPLRQPKCMDTVELTVEDQQPHEPQ